MSLVIVVDGEATQLKWSTMDQREKVSQGRGGAYHHRNRQTGRRTLLDLKIKEVRVHVHMCIIRAMNCIIKDNAVSYQGLAGFHLGILLWVEMGVVATCVAWLHILCRSALGNVSFMKESLLGAHHY